MRQQVEEIFEVSSMLTFKYAEARHRRQNSKKIAFNQSIGVEQKNRGKFMETKWCCSSMADERADGACPNENVAHTSVLSLAALATLAIG